MVSQVFESDFESDLDLSIQQGSVLLVALGTSTLTSQFHLFQIKSVALFSSEKLYLSPLEGRSPERGDRQSSSSQYHETCASKCQSPRLGNQVSTRDSITGP